ncbi:aromatic amino acid lyase [Jatrophihabitans telluris]|uniref:Aromatic amino acid lyase n=1 Tax=Jatrophihabitans telluris TaxID=2038343 RepID=A0ABY4QZ07_9ACTN|nr:aromatic amino acid lyase [Jatrophihabitans telluris]UQX88748.1 aromatic amino acid lyase [Jatrophihabitans telluris]
MIELDGRALTVAQIAAIAVRGDGVQVSAQARHRVQRSQSYADRAAAERPIYGRSTGVGANRTQSVTDAESQAQALIRSHATAAGPLRSAPRVRAMLAIRLNQLAADGNGASPVLLDALADLIDRDALPPVREYGGIGTADLPALAATALVLSGELPASQPIGEAIVLGSGDALPFLSSNAATLADAALAVDELSSLARACLDVAALSFTAVDGNPEAFAAAVELATPFPGASQVCERLRTLLSGASTPARIQDPFGLRTLPQVHGAFLDALARLESVVTGLVNAASENPAVSATAGVAHHGGFQMAYLAQALDAALLAAAQSAQLSLARLTMLAEPAITGLAPFLGDGTPAASGTMIVEYTAASALSALRALAMPASLQTVTLSRGVEEDASFASQSAAQALSAIGPYRVVLAGELVAAVRAVRLRAIDGASFGVALSAVWAAVSSLPRDLADRNLTDDLTQAETLLTTQLPTTA